jgi:addiction module HigA family antidote
VKVINRLVNGRTRITAPLALKLAAALDTSPEFWLNAQEAVDIYQAAKAIDKLPKPLLLKGHLTHASSN